MRRLSAFLLIFLVSTFSSIVARAMEISGTVLDKDANPLVGVSVVASTNHSIGCSTDANGSFKITNFPTGAKVQISCVGMESQELDPVEDMGEITLLEDVQWIEAVVVTAERKGENKSSENSEEQDDDDKSVENPNTNTLPAPSSAIDPKKKEELDKKLQSAKDKEQSNANKLLGAAATGAAGIGLKNTLSAMSEQQADKDAESAMKAYLETFHCNYGDSNSFKGGERDVILPGGNDLASLYQEYISLASDLKIRKEALGLHPGIESEVILEASKTGLYDDIGVGVTGGAFASIARALQNPDGDDAAAWQAQKDASAKKQKTGLITAGAGVAVGALGSLAKGSNGAIQKFSDKLGNVIARGTGGGGVLAANGQSVGGIWTGLSGGGVAAGTSNQDANLARAEAACNTLRSDVSARANTIYDNILTVQTAAEEEDIEGTATIGAAVKDAAASKSAIAVALAAADDALAKAQEETVPTEDECKLNFEEDEPVQGIGEDVEADEDDEKFAKRKDRYAKGLQAAEKKLAQCQKDAKAKYDSNLSKYQAKTKRYADEAERQLNIGRTELNKMQTALSNAERVKSDGVAAKQRQAEKEAAEARAKEELQQEIDQQVQRVSVAAQNARQYYDAAREVSQSAALESGTDESTEAAEDQINSLKGDIAYYLEQAKVAMESAEKEIDTVNSAKNVKTATAAADAAERYANVVLERKNAMAATFEKIKAAKESARQEYLQEQADSEESEKNVEEEED